MAIIDEATIGLRSSNFHWPKLSAIDLGVCRSPGAGLGNLLFPISRALIGRARHGGQFVYPTMRQIKIGTYLRGERDKRTYGDVLRGRSAEDWRCWFAASARTSIDENKFDGSQQGVTVCYAGLGRYFHDLDGHRELIAHWLSLNVRGRRSPEPFDIGIHVRLGDFTATDPDTPRNNIRQPLEWYRTAFHEARHILGVRAPSVVLFTDSDPSEVESGLGIGPLLIDESENALLAISRLSRARLLIASRSTFSMWASYLGGIPVIWDRRYDRTQAFPERPGLDYEV